MRREIFVRVILNGVKEAVVAQGVILWAEEGLLGGGAGGSVPDAAVRMVMANVSNHVALLEAVIRQHEVMLHAVMAVL